ncbi:serine hydrolase [Paenibacillus sp. CF384]|uniref:serine hydrolase domain-containing protein n=1 Tax=Paenibacillus sp. CF384 TaxID=1884382 RepID=UPI00089A3086|nr:serine hydrolase domain-containing protein [Paenibacillus sp. CF384]SDW07004.1 CubicO group peptidase, beta-lactamase class C family [Paenibacillus sp. CF384]
MQLRIQNLDRLIHSAVDNKQIFGAVVHVESGDRQLTWGGAAGNMDADSRFFIASATKLYVTAALLNLLARNQIKWTDPIALYLDKRLLAGLHHYQGTEYSCDITIEQLMAHTSGLPDYFQHKRKSGKSLADEIMSGHDQAWSLLNVIEEVKQMKPHFAPGTKGKALYSDTNYQLLGQIIETVTNQPLNEVFKQYIYEPLSLSDTYLYTNIHDHTPSPLYYKDSPLHIPLAMASFGPDGGIVSTAEELMRFLRAFMEGTIFPKNYLSELYVWNKIFFPLQYGKGIAKFKLPRLFSPFKPLPELIGHSGLSGAFAYYSPKHDLYLCGTVNQISPPSLSYKLMLRIINTLSATDT